MHSCLYDGFVEHRRFTPVSHGFTYRLFMVYLDLDEVSELVNSGLLSGHKSSPASFLAADHLKQHSCSLSDGVRTIVENTTGNTPTGPIRLLTQLRIFGFFFSPLNLFYCFDASGHRVEYIVAEVNNTPWGEQHCYVLWEGNRLRHPTEFVYQHQKELHVSPFMDMNQQYRWRLQQPQDEMRVQLRNLREGCPIFEASLSLQQQPLTRASLARHLFRFPFMTAQIVAAIYYQAFRLWMKKCPFYPHPKQPVARPVQSTARGICPTTSSSLKSVPAKSVGRLNPAPSPRQPPPPKTIQR